MQGGLNKKPNILTSVLKCLYAAPSVTEYTAGFSPPG